MTPRAGPRAARRCAAPARRRQPHRLRHQNTLSVTVNFGSGSDTAPTMNIKMDSDAFSGRLPIDYRPSPSPASVRDFAGPGEIPRAVSSSGHEKGGGKHSRDESEAHASASSNKMSKKGSDDVQVPNQKKDGDDEDDHTQAT